MEQLNLVSLILGFVLGIILLLLNRMNTSKNTEQLRNQLNDALNQQKIIDEKWKKEAADYRNLEVKHDSKLQEFQSLIAENSALINSIQNAKELVNKSVLECTDLKNFNQIQQQENSEIKQRFAELNSQNRFLLEKLNTQKSEFEEIRKQAQVEFQNIANKILEEKSQKFTASNKESIDTILKPLGENLDQFRKKVEETYDKESKQRFSLEEKVKELVEMNQRLSQEANNLTSALKGQSKKQGNWGEIILESILEKSGLQKNREYKVQVSVQNEEGRRLQPDVIVYLPDARTIVIDSKVSLVAYDRFSSADSREDQDLALKEHITSMYNHIDQLGDKKYDTIVGTLDFTMMFIPIEPAYIIAIQEDQELWAYAYAKRILLISPTNLIASLKLIADLWKREQQSKNAMEIAKQGEKLYEKIIGFLESMEDVGKHINKSQDSYHKAVSQLRDGRGSLIKRAENMKKLGLNSQKEIPSTMIPFEDADSELDFGEATSIEE
ncbi:MAG: DNA recombination protein RmuC [Saprospiraceae bacterium]|nr:DNA recombination protein RmuC [Saprospiraceae bacterium]